MQLTSFKSINKIAIPAIIAGIVEPILSATDTAIVGNIPENAKEALAAVGLVGIVLSSLIWIFGQTRSVISSVISQYLGAGKIAEIKTMPAQAIALNICISLILSTTTFIFAEPIFRLLFKAEGQTLDYCLQYFNIRIWGYPFSLFLFSIIGVFSGLQNTFWPMIISIIGATLNIVLDIILVYGIDNYIPAMHIEGAAWASLIAQITMGLLALYFLLKKTDISLKISKNIHPEMKRIIGMTLNLIIRAISLNIAIALAGRTASKIGEEFMAAHTIAWNIWLFSAFFIDGYAAAGKIFGGRLYGAKDFNQLNHLVKKLSLYGLIIGVFLMILGGIFYYPIGQIFTQEKEVLLPFYGVFFMVLLVQPLNAVAFILDGVFKGLGEMKFLRNLLLIATFVGFIPSLYLFQYLELKLVGVWIALAVWLLFRCLGMIIYFKKKFSPSTITTF